MIRVKSVHSHTKGRDVGYIRITEFDGQTTDGLKKAIGDLTRKLGADKIKGKLNLLAVSSSDFAIGSASIGQCENLDLIRL